MIGRTYSRQSRRALRTFNCGLILSIVFAAIGYANGVPAAKAKKPAPAANPTHPKRSASPEATHSVFTNPAGITINDASSATPYPSTITVSGLVGHVTTAPESVRVIINGFSHTFPDDVGMVLVGPTGAALLIQDGAGDDPNAVNIDYALGDIGATQLPDSTIWPGGTYKPTNYVFPLEGFPSPGPTTFGNPGPAGGGTATFASTFGGTAPNGNWSLYVVDFVAQDSGVISAGWSLDITTDAPVNCTNGRKPFDFDADGTSDYVVARNTGGGPSGQLTWFIRDATTGAAGTAVAWGLNGDKFVPADYDGDSMADIAIWRAGFTYALLTQSNTLKTVAIGAPGDDPSVVGNYDNSGNEEAAVYRDGANPGDPSYWIYRPGLGDGGLVTFQWGTHGDVPVPGDYDADGKFDFVVRRDNGNGQATFFEHFSSSAPDATVVFGTPTDKVVPGLWDSDCKTDLAVVRGLGGQLAWYYLSSVDGSTGSMLWGLSATDYTVQGDYDGDGKTDFAIWRPNADPTMNAFFVKRSSDGNTIVQPWGLAGDYPPANFNTH
jgi:hypothetical protein